VAAPSPKASLGRRTVCGRTEQRRLPVSKLTKLSLEWYGGVFLLRIAAATLKTPTRNGYNAQGVNLTSNEVEASRCAEAAAEAAAQREDLFRCTLCWGRVSPIHTYKTNIG